MKRTVIILCSLLSCVVLWGQNGIMVLQTDFGVKDGAVAAMKGVAMNVSGNLKLFDLTHEIPPYNVWEAAYRLEQTASYWPAGTVFVSVVDPGVGSDRRSIVLKTRSGHYFVTPDNGTITLVAASLGIDEVRIINEKINRLKGSGESYTFHGRDVFAYTGARLASHAISFREVGPELPGKMVMIPYQSAVLENNILKGGIPVLDIQFGNVWTNIPDRLVKKMNITPGDTLKVDIYETGIQKFTGFLPFVKTFSGVQEQEYLSYMNSLQNLSFAINKGDFAENYQIKSGPHWTVEVRKKTAGSF